MKHLNVTYESSYEGMPINTNKEKNQGCITEILELQKGILDDQIAKHNKVHVLRFDLRFPQGICVPDDNSAISTFCDTYTRNLKNNGADPKIVWAREQSREKHQHYHCMLAVDGNKHQEPHNLLKKAEKYWGKAVGMAGPAKGQVDYCNKGREGNRVDNRYNIRSDDPNKDKVYADCFYRCSYMAKVNTKGYQPKEKHTYGGSRYSR